MKQNIEELCTDWKLNGTQEQNSKHQHFLMFITLTKDRKGQSSIVGYLKQKKKKKGEKIIYREDRILAKKLEVRNHWESTWSYISFFNKVIAYLFIGLVLIYIET